MELATRISAQLKLPYISLLVTVRNFPTQHFLLIYTFATSKFLAHQQHPITISILILYPFRSVYQLILPAYH